ncbi:undecaprenyldiphospho-muramoylpentapeptide beta-N-acetylglucosaminyltransferase [Sorangium cellulosum]|uniref:UDP-N-acetylglucosamine--N-acetylmuramyl-(pentapeptide) pyrophosphoryl-undecaprenol N-acetylglucosamine transferase n=1 Tax=Sorangium cellulosum TaxID=56 RepID=A0A150QJX5_SORCE|nr:undecaprenyldiphospho-muramoylpentapeptide beta-N-acetylglucosaminyltransferase [Sorangium cellulosum]KYF67996.1 UDP-N-acetylglucosamine--N-acetylmuramyl-(pentapeptide) pyrophosphoryl-undecaprenol N-acetylglucosamine transferase [Sorangium cellulosum]
MTTVLIAGGGTGGHVFPMIAVGDAVRAAAPEARVVYVGTARGIEVRVMGERGDDLELLHVLPLRGGGLSGFVRGAARAGSVLPEARRLVERLDARVVLSLGGYAGGPVSLAARSLGVPVAILEPNSVLGLSNRLLSPLVDRAYVAFPETARALRPSAVRLFGVPLRRAFARAPYAPREGRLSLLVLGGSQGALALNDVVPRAIAQGRERGLDLDVVHQTGRDREAAVRSLYAELGLSDRARVVPFIDDVAEALAAADVVIARAGASTLAELCAVGRPSILIPYPFAADDHQMKNAQSLERASAAVAIAQADATEARIAGELARLVAAPALRARMADAAAAFGTPDAAARVAADLLELARAPRHRALRFPIGGARAKRAAEEAPRRAARRGAAPPGAALGWEEAG